MRKIAFANQKGGVGKTTSVISTGAALAKIGMKCLLIDADPQAHLSISLGIAPNSSKPGIYEVLRGEVPASGAIIKRDRHENPLWILPSSIDLAGADIELSSIAGREYILREALEDITGFDYCLIDCGPSLGLITLNTMTYVDNLFVPLQVEFLALQGLSKLLEIVEVSRKRLNKNLNISGVICTMVDRRKKLHREVIENVYEHFGEVVFKTFIRHNISLAEAPSHGQTIFEYRPDSSGANDFLALAKEIIERRL